jgi:hypothetical protein
MKMLWNGNELGKTRVIRISRHPFPVKLMLDQKNCRMWNLLNIYVAFLQMMEDVFVELNPGLL